MLLGCGCVVRIEGAEATASPACLEGDGCFFLAFILLLLQPARESEEGTEQSGAVIVEQFDQPSLLHEAAQLDELAGACAAFLHPVAGVMAGAVEGEPIPLHGQAPQLRHGGLEVPEQDRRRRASSPVWFLAERRPARVRSTS